ncbi:hypothetical protein RJ639_041134 [Escallonia herrerae]|uniref:TFIIB-type domain-containing protein n=2 Tax=Escallonia herrerae TaxID=1293975 RepID=A0AA88WJ78_9ASTE|nr:hypothetical protein RJ639_041134 [Escallonia herrerae]
MPRTPTPEFSCSDCRKETEVVFDHSTGDTVCSECGLVLESRCIDETSEWRTFADDSTDRDPARVGSPVDPLLMGDGQLTTRISIAKAKGFNTITGGDAEPNVTWVHGRGAGGDRDRVVVMGFETIANMCDRLSLVATIKDRAREMYKRLEDQKCTRGRNLEALAAGCLFIACRQEGKPRTIKEICSVANGASKKDIGRAKEFIVKQLAVEMGQSMELGATSAGDYLRRFCSNLGMSSKEVKAVQEAVQKSEAIDIRRAPISIAGAIIYMITQLSDEKKSLKDIALSTSVSEATIRSVYKDLYPYASRIVPNWYASDKDLINNRSARPLLIAFNWDTSTLLLTAVLTTRMDVGTMLAIIKFAPDGSNLVGHRYAERFTHSNRSHMADAYCSDCKRNTEVVFDHSAGDTVCSECGLVLESHSIDETSEWRTFANESGDNDPVRVGGPTNPLLTDGGLSTVISKPNGVTSDFLSSSLGRWQNRGSNPDRSLILAFKTIATMSDRLGLVATIKDRANEIYKKVEDQKSSRGRNQDAILAACLYIACRQEDKPRTVKEICSVANGATKKEIGRAKEYIVKQLELEMGQSVEMGTIHAGDFMRRFCSNLGMTNQAVKAAQEAVHKSEEFDIRRSPISIAAAVIYIVTQLSDDKKPLKDVAIATGVAEGTIRNSYKDLYPHLSKIIPGWYAQEEDLKNLCSP